VKTRPIDEEGELAEQEINDDGTPPIFEGITQSPNQPRTELKRVPALMSDSLDHELTLEFLDDIINTEVADSFTLLD